MVELSNAATLFDESGTLVTEGTRKFFDKYLRGVRRVDRTLGAQVARAAASQRPRRASVTTSWIASATAPGASRCRLCPDWTIRCTPAVESLASAACASRRFSFSCLAEIAAPFRDPPL